MRARAFVLINLAAGASEDVLMRLEKLQPVPGIQQTITCNVIFLEN